MKGVTRPSEREFLDLNCYKIYEGTKQFWRHNLSMEIILVEHCTVNTIEVICYCQELEQEAKRLYIDYYGIVQTVQEPISDNLKIKSQLLLRQNLSDLQIAEILHSYELDLQCELSCESIVNRVDVLSLDPSFQISLRVTYGDELDSSKKKLCFTIDKPKQLIPYYSHKRIKVVRSLDEYDFHPSFKDFHYNKKSVNLAANVSRKFRTAIVQDQSQLLSPAKMKWKKAIRKIAMQKYVDDMKLFLKEKFPQNYGTKEDLKLNTKHLSPRGKSSASLNELAPLIISQDNQYTPKYEAFDFTEDHGLRTKVSAGDSSKRTPKGLKAIKSREEDDLVVISLSSRNQAFTTPKALPPLHPATRRTVEKILDTDQCIHGDEEDSIDHVHLRKVDKIAAFKSLNPFSTDCIFPTKAVPDAQRKLLDEINQGLPQLDVMSACSYLRSTVASQSHAHLKTKKKLKRKKKVHNDTNDIVSVPSLEQCIGNEEHVALMYSINPVKYRTVAEMLDPVEPCLSIDSSDNKASSDEDFSVLGNSVDGDSGKFNGVNLPKIAKKNRNDWFENSAQPLFVKISSSNEKEKKEKTIGNGTISSSGKYKPYVVRDTKKTLEKMKKLGAYT